MKTSSNISTLRSKGFSIVQVGGPITRVANNAPFTVNGKPAREVAARYEFNIRGWFDKQIERDIRLV